MKAIQYLLVAILIHLINLCCTFADIPDSCLVAYWSFDDSTARDNSGNGYNGIIKNNPTPVPGLKGTCFHFQGKNSYISNSTNESPIGDNIVLPNINFVSMNEFTISMFVKEEVYDRNNGGEGFFFGGDHNLGWIGMGKIRVNYAENPLTTKFSVGADTNIIAPLAYHFDFNLLQKWVHYCLVYSNGIIKAYINGQFVASKSENIRINSSRITGNYFGIACHWWTYPNDCRKSARFTGYIDEVKIFRCALSPCEIATLFREFFPIERPKILGDSINCSNTSILLTLSKNYLNYLWSTGESTKTIYVQDPGIYKVYVTDSNLCTDSALINIHFISKIQPKITETGSLCQDTVKLTLDKQYSSYLWSTGETTSSITITIPGTYIVNVADENGCVGNAQITVNSDQSLLEISTLLPDGSFSLDSSNYTGVNCKTIKIKNRGTAPIIINDILLFHNISFSLPQSQFPIYIDSNETKNLIICYTPSKLGIERDTMQWGSNCANIFIPLKAFGTINEFDADSRCNLQVSVRTKRISGTIFSVNKTIISNSSIALDFSLYSNEFTDSDIKAVLYNFIGSFVENGLVSVFSSIQNKIGIDKNGSIEINVGNLANGIYFCVITAGNYKTSIPLILSE